MILTFFYMYATFLQWWRLGVLKNKLKGTLNANNALLVCDDFIIYEAKKKRSLENLLFKLENRVGCTVVPMQKINLSHWLTFPADPRNFPIHFENRISTISYPKFHVVVQAMLDTYTKHAADLLEIENFGELVAWRAPDCFEVLLKTDLDGLSKLVHCFSQGDIDINHEMKLLRIETVEVEGIPTRIKYDIKFPKEYLLKYSYLPKHWQQFAETVKQIYSRIRETTPKITIENGKPEETRRVPVSEVKPIKKAEDKNSLEVATEHYRRHKTNDHKREKNSTKNVEGRVKEESKHRTPKSDGKAERRREDSKSRRDESKKKEVETKTNEAVAKPKQPEPETGGQQKAEKHPKSSSKAKERPKKEAGKSARTKQEVDKVLTKRSSSSEKKLTKSTAVCDDTDCHLTVAKLDVKVASSAVKPPNILVYADSLVAKENVKSVLAGMLNKEKYTIYDLPTDPSQDVWNDSTVLVVVCGNVPPSLTAQLLQFLVTGGQLLCLCSDFLYSVLHTFTTAEVREHELVRFTYGKWKQVKMMHHIFCYQASPAKKQFSKDSDQSHSSGNGSSPIAPRTPSAVEIQHNGKHYIVQVQVLGTEETWQTPSLLSATIKGGEGRAIFSQVHLEINPNQYEEDESKFEALKDSDSARMEILKDILSNRLDIECCQSVEVVYAPAYFLGRHEVKLKVLNECESIKENKLECEKVILNFCGKDVDPGKATRDVMPVLIHSCPTNFSTVNYFEALETEHIGRLVIYSDVMTSSHNVVAKPLTHGLVVIPRQQTQGFGRSNNVWISPIGCAMFSMQLHIPRETTLGKYLPLVQQVGMVAVISALKSIAGSEQLDVGLKWPNDLYANGSVKIGGLLTTSSVSSDKAVVNLGCGINLDNGNPTLCINDMIRVSNETKGTSMKKISYENYFAAVFNETERIMKMIQGGNIDCLYDLYYKYWLHNDSEVVVTTADGKSERVKIVGIDDYGFLRVRTSKGKITSVHSDGNTFDMLKGLIFPKPF